MRHLRKIYWGLPNFLFSAIFNIKGIFKKSKIRIRFRNGICEVKDLEFDMIWYCHRARLTLYCEGLKFRGNHIGGQYGLDYCIFHDGDTIVDCGANMGDLQLYFHFLGVKVNYIGFEPSNLDFSCLKRNLISPGVVHNIALWNSNSQISFYLDSAGANSSGIEPPYFTEKIIVKAMRLDELVPQVPIALFKVEAEGAEPEVLEGATRMMNQINYVAVDAGPERGIVEAPTLVEVVDFMSENDFVQIGIKNGWRRLFQYQHKNFTHNEF